MSFWDNVKKFAQPYADDDYDDYDEDEEYLDDYEEPAAPARRAPARRRAPEPAPVEDLEDDDDDFGFGLAAAAPKAAPATTTTGFNPSERAFDNTNLVCGIGPSCASTMRSTPSAIFSVRSTSPEKSACPGVSMILIL